MLNRGKNVRSNLKIKIKNSKGNFLYAWGINSYSGITIKKKIYAIMSSYIWASGFNRKQFGLSSVYYGTTFVLSFQRENYISYPRTLSTYPHK